MTKRRFWVIGGEFADTSFMTLTCQRASVAGPFASEDEAKAVWRDLSTDRTSSALTRYSILHEDIRLAG
jgi:hypothetical protein